MHRPRASSPREYDGVMLPRVDRVPHDVPRLVPKHGRLQRGHAVGVVRVCVEWEHVVPDEVLDEGEGPTGGDVVRVDGVARAEGANEAVAGAANLESKWISG